MNIESAQDYSEMLKRLFQDNPHYMTKSLQDEVPCPICGHDIRLIDVVKENCAKCQLIDSEKHDWEDSV